MESRLQKWINEQTAKDTMLWKGAFMEQILFVRDRLVYLVGGGLPFEQMDAVADVVSTHHSKSIALPVYDLRRPDLGLRLVLRGNFYNWKLSVISDAPIVADFSGLFHTTPPVDPSYTGDELAGVYFEGFPKDLIFGYYEPSDKKRWSAQLGDDYDVHMAIFLIMRALGAVKPRVWSTSKQAEAVGRV